MSDFDPAGDDAIVTALARPPAYCALSALAARVCDALANVEGRPEVRGLLRRCLALGGAAGSVGLDAALIESNLQMVEGMALTMEAIDRGARANPADDDEVRVLIGAADRSLRAGDDLEARRRFGNAGAIAWGSPSTTSFIAEPVAATCTITVQGWASGLAMLLAAREQRRA